MNRRSLLASITGLFAGAAIGPLPSLPAAATVAAAPERETISGWFRVQLLGHRTHYGYVTDLRAGEQALFRLEALGRDGSTTTLFIGVGAVYALEPISEAEAREAMRPFQPVLTRSVNVWPTPATRPDWAAFQDHDDTFDGIYDDETGPPF